MAQTNAVCDLFCTNLSPDGRYTLSFTNASARDSYFDSIVLSNRSYTNCVFLRQDGIIKVPVNCEVLDDLGVNYIRFKNPDFSPDWVYSFVDHIEYVAPNVSALHIHNDSFMTYQFNIVSTPQYIERRTVNANEDTKYKNLLDEPISGTNYELDARIKAIENLSTEGSFYNRYYIGIVVRPFVVSEGEWLNETEDPNKSVKVSLNNWAYRYFNGYPCGGLIFVCVDKAHLDTTISMVQALGSEVLASFFVPHFSGSQVGISGENAVSYYIQNVATKIGYTVYVRTLTSCDISTYPTDGGTMSDAFDNDSEIINNKCYNYPFSYIVASDNNGSEIIYRFEHFYNDAMSFSFQFITSPNNAIIMRPNNYMSTNATLDNAMIVEGFPQIPFTTDAYAYYLGTHAAQTAVARYQRYLDYGKSILNLGHSVYDAFQANGDKEEVNAGFGVASSGFGVAQQGINFLKSRAEFSDMRQQGLNVVNAGSVSTRSALGYLGIILYHKYLCPHDIRLVDAFFSKYGYAWERIENLNYNHCPDYDFIKTKHCNIAGTIPLKDKNAINELFDSGITIWHDTTRYGIYADSSHKNK